MNKRTITIFAGIEQRVRNIRHAILVDITSVQQLHYHTIDEKWITFGAGYTLSEVQAACSDAIKKLTGSK